MIFTDLMKYISSEQNIRLAYRNIKGNTGSRTAGADNKTISHLAKWEISALIQHIQKKLNYYQPQKVRRVEYGDPFCQDSFLINLSLGGKRTFL